VVNVGSNVKVVAEFDASVEPFKVIVAYWFVGAAVMVKEVTVEEIDTE
jgi:hypothetical protein